MRIALALVLVLGACGSKKAPKSPVGANNAAPAERGSAESDMKSSTTPDQPDDAPTMRTSDPCEGGE